MKASLRISLPLLATLVALAVLAPVAAATFAPALLLIALLALGVRPGERHIERLLRRGIRRPRYSRCRVQPLRLPLVIRPAGRLIAAALAVRPPPALAPAST